VFFSNNAGNSLAIHIDQKRLRSVRESSPAQINLFAVNIREFITFIVCLLSALFFLFTSNKPQADRIRSLVVDFAVTPLSFTKSSSTVSSTKDELKRLRKKNTHLLLENSQLRDAAFENQRLRSMLALKNREEYRLVSAEVIGVSRDTQMRSIILDVGTDDSVAVDMAIISPDGLCGKIVSVGKKSASAQLMLDHNFRVACKIERTRIDGILAFEDGQFCLLKEVQKNADVRIGDVVITSGFSRLFPQKIRVGLVVSVNDKNPSLFKTIQVKPDVDFSRLEEVFVVITENHPEEKTN